MANPSSAPLPETALSLVRRALPIGTFYLAEILVGLTDLAVVGALGTLPLAAVGLAKAILLSFMAVGFAVLSIGTVFMAENPTPAHCGRIVAASLVLIVPFAALTILAGSQLGLLLTRSGYDAELVILFDAYARVLAWTIGPALVFAPLKNVLNAIGRTAAIGWLSVGIVLANLAGSIALVHGVGGWNGMGVAGAAWATLGVNVGAAAILFAHVMRRSFVTFASVRLGTVLRTARDLFGLGWAAGAQQALESVLFVAVLYLLGLYSAVWLAAGTIAFAVMELVYASSGALGEVLAARIAALRAAGQRAELLRTLRLGAWIAGAAAAVLALGVGLFPHATVALFSSSQTPETTREFVETILRWTAPFFLFDAWQTLFVHSLRGLRRTVLPMVLSTTCYWLVGIGGGLMLAEPFGLNALGVWIGFCAGLASAATLLAIMAFKAGRAVIPTGELPPANPRNLQ